MQVLVPYSLMDRVFRQRLWEIVVQHEIYTIVETGIDKGMSTAVLATMVQQVFGIDNNAEAIRTAHTNLEIVNTKNAVLIYGNSPGVLRALQPSLPDNTLYFLDAHWNDYWPILDEIAAIRKETGVIVMHDFVVPGHPELMGMEHKGKILDYAYVKDALTEWSPTHRIEYNSKAEVAVDATNADYRRGIAYVFPK